ncbi:homeobox protein 2-like [Leptopilina heterotoma]|uniref:homeobox protein 2-like n=1 Tax=Leptopilina heterotoma TaxID=63436 RepID=UPI001CA80C2A|nr:homeobox protein 2-like [Leptopilina heterotoma]
MASNDPYAWIYDLNNYQLGDELRDRGLTAVGAITAKRNRLLKFLQQQDLAPSNLGQNLDQTENHDRHDIESVRTLDSWGNFSNSERPNNSDINRLENNENSSQLISLNEDSNEIRSPTNINQNRNPQRLIVREDVNYRSEIFYPRDDPFHSSHFGNRNYENLVPPNLTPNNVGNSVSRNYFIENENRRRVTFRPSDEISEPLQSRQDIVGNNLISTSENNAPKNNSDFNQHQENRDRTNSKSNDSLEKNDYQNRNNSLEKNDYQDRNEFREKSNYQDRNEFTEKSNFQERNNYRDRNDSRYRERFVNESRYDSRFDNSRYDDRRFDNSKYDDSIFYDSRYNDSRFYNDRTDRFQKDSKYNIPRNKYYEPRQKLRNSFDSNSDSDLNYEYNSRNQSFSNIYRGYHNSAAKTLEIMQKWGLKFSGS